MRLRRQLDADRVARPYIAAGQHDGHDSGFADEAAVLGTLQGRPHQTWLNAVQLGAGVAQTGHLDNRHVAETKARAGRQPQEIDTAGRHILAHLPGRDGEALFSELVMQLGVDQVHLTQIGLARVARHRERCLTVAPEWASPSTPRPASSRIMSPFGLIRVCPALRLTAVTTPPIVIS